MFSWSITIITHGTVRKELLDDGKHLLHGLTV